MDILIQDSWLREYLETDATPKQIQECLSLCGPSVEKVEEIDGETVYHVEVTTNRVTDSASVRGIAREAAAILPRFGIKAEYKNSAERSGGPSLQYKKQVPYLNVQIEKPELCPRFTAVLLRNVQIKPSNEKIVKRLERNGLRGINNVIDLTNYLTIELGQPMHVFDYDEIKNHKMILRESREGEEIQTLDEVKRKIPAGAIVIEDGGKRLIDLCGVMGGFLSHTKGTSKNILLFIQTYDPVRIRKACQATSFRTDAAGLFEKWVDPEGIPNALSRALEIIEEEIKPERIEDIIDIYPNPVSPKTVICPLEKLYAYADEKIDEKEILRILNSLEIKSEIKDRSIVSRVPSFRNRDIEIPEDIIEEVVRIYGYFNLKGKLPEGELPNLVSDDTSSYLPVEKKIKELLANTGFTEIYTLSMISTSVLEQLNLSRENLVKIANPLNENENIMRPSLFPSLKKVVDDNLNREEKIAIFEMSNTYNWTSGELPEEKMMLGIITYNHNFSEIKGKLEYVFKQLGISYDLSKSGNKLNIGEYGTISLLENNVIYIELDVALLVKNYSNKKTLIPVPKFPEAYEDLTLIVPKNILYKDIVKLIKGQSNLISRVQLIDEYDISQTLRVVYLSKERNIESNDIKPIREKILKELEGKFQIKLKA